MIIASLVRTRERFMGIGQLVMMPLFFASSALYPLEILPGWIRAIAIVNPLTYEVHGMRELLLGVSVGALWLDFAVVGLFLALAAGLAAKGGTLENAAARLAATFACRDAAEIRALVTGCDHGRWLASLGEAFAGDVRACGEVDVLQEACEW